MLHLLSGPLFFVDKVRGNALANPFFLRVERTARFPAAIAAQERRDQAVMRLIMLLVGGPLGFGLWQLAQHWAVLVFAAVGSVYLVYTPIVKRWIELGGHALEIEAAVEHYGADREGMRREEALDLWHGYGGAFRKYGSPEAIEELLEDWQPSAEREAARMRKRILADMRRAG